MQVASVLFGNGGALADLIEASQRARFSRGPIAKPTADIAREQIAAATRLSSADKKSLNQLVGVAQQFAKGNTGMMRNILGLANLMQIGRKEEPYSMAPSLAKVIESYYAPRDPISGANIKLDT